MPTYTGMCRIAGKEGEPNRVRVTDGDMIWEDVDEPHYRLAVIRPPIEELTWCAGCEPTSHNHPKT